jgi:hypothetical protein
LSLSLLCLQFSVEERRKENGEQGEQEQETKRVREVRRGRWVSERMRGGEVEGGEEGGKEGGEGGEEKESRGDQPEMYACARETFPPSKPSRIRERKRRKKEVERVEEEEEEEEEVNWTSRSLIEYAKRRKEKNVPVTQSNNSGFLPNRSESLRRKRDREKE